MRPEHGDLTVHGVGGYDEVVEPDRFTGLYVPEWGGMRLEGNYLVTATGFERLDRFPSALIAAAD